MNLLSAVCCPFTLYLALGQVVSTRYPALSFRTGFASLGTTDTLDQVVHCGGGESGDTLSCTLQTFSSIRSLYPLDAGSTPHSQSRWSELSLDITRCALELKPPWWRITFVESYRSKGDLHASGHLQTAGYPRDYPRCFLHHHTYCGHPSPITVTLQFSSPRLFGLCEALLLVYVLHPQFMRLPEKRSVCGGSPCSPARGTEWHLYVITSERMTYRTWSCHQEVICIPFAVLMGTIFSILLVTMILMAFCVYKPIRRR